MGALVRAGPLRAKSNRTGTLSGSPIRRECLRARGCSMPRRTTSRRKRRSAPARTTNCSCSLPALPGFAGDVRIAEAIKDSNPHIKIAFVGPHVSVLPEKSLMEAKVIDIACRKEFDYSIVEYAQDKPIEDILGISYRKNGQRRA